MLQIRRAEPADASAMSLLMLGERSHITLRPDGEGAQAILASMQTPAIQVNLASPRFAYWVASLEDHLCGVLGMRDGQHLHHLFVPTAMHRRGIARSLWAHALAALPHSSDIEITVNASPYAVPAYERLGFRATGARTETHGVAFIPMHFFPSNQPNFQGAPT
ncbi:MAG: GNAT family N-acetyltransferase [Burkholderiaceae bacterium]